MPITNSPTALLSLTLLTLYILYTRTTLHLRRRAFKAQHHCQPCPRVYHTDPLFALDTLRESVAAARDRRLQASNRQRFAKMGAYTYHTRLVTRPWIVTVEPANLKTVLSVNFKDYSLGDRTHAFAALLGDGIFNSDGGRWARSRHLLRPSFARDQVADLECLERHVKKLLRRIPREGGTVDLQRLFFRLTLDSATEFLFDASTGSLDLDDDGGDEVGGEKGPESLFASAFDTATADILQQFRWGWFKRFRPGRVQGEDAVRTCHAYVERFVDEAIQWRAERDSKKTQSKPDDDDDDDDDDAGEGRDRYVFIRELVMQTTDRTRLRNELMNVLLAGRDTTASLLGSLFFELAKQPALWEELRGEVAGLEGRPPSYEELKGFRRVRYCLNEALRLYPVVPGNARLAIRDTVLPLGGGLDSKSPLFVPAGTTVAWNSFTLHRRPDIYGADADVFRPSRWETLRTAGWEYLPFNGGPRICLGQQYALAEAGYVTVRLLQEFARIESRDGNGGVWVEGLSLTMCSGNGTLVGLFAE